MTGFYYAFEKSPMTKMTDDEVMCVLERLSPKEVIVVEQNNCLYRITRPKQFSYYRLYNYHTDTEWPMEPQQIKTYVSTLIKMNYGG